MLAARMSDRAFAILEQEIADLREYFRPGQMFLQGETGMFDRETDAAPLRVPGDEIRALVAQWVDGL